jgi:hypothetical protein
MSKRNISEKGSLKSSHIEKALDSNEIYEAVRELFVDSVISISWSSSSSRSVFELANSLSSKSRETGLGLGLAFSRMYLTFLEDRLARLETDTFSNGIKLRRLEDHIKMLQGTEQEEEKDWPAYASEEFTKLVENRKGLEDAGEDKDLILYYIMEIEALLGDVEGKARVTNREYEARLAATLRDICRIHEPSELSNEQIKCFTGSLQALIEGWGLLNREKVKWIRGRLLEVGLTWLPVTKKALRDIGEAKSSVK